MNNWLIRTGERFDARIARLSTKARIALAFTMAPFIYLALYVSLSGRLGHWGLAGFLCAMATGNLTQRLMAPYWRSRTEKAKRRYSSASGFLLPIFLLFFIMWQVPIAAQGNEAAAGLPLIAVWALYAFIAGSQEPKEFPLEHLRVRFARAAFLRVSTNWCGIIGFIWFLSHSITDKKLNGPIFSASLTLTAAVTVASLRTYSRVRKLCTRIHTEAQTLIRDLEELRSTEEPGDRAAKRAIARRTWDNLNRLLHNRIDTGFHRYGIFVLPGEAISALEAKVVNAVDADPPTETAHKAILEDLRVVKAACEPRLDDVA